MIPLIYDEVERDLPFNTEAPDEHCSLEDLLRT